MTILKLLLGLLLVAWAAFEIQVYVWKRSGTKTPYPVRVDGKPFTVWVHFGSKFARETLKTQGFAIDYHIGMAWLREQVSRNELCHEVLHLVRFFLLQQKYGRILGWVIYRVESALALLQRVHNRRGLEEEVRRGQKGLAVDGVEQVLILGKMRLVEAPWVLGIPTP